MRIVTCKFSSHPHKICCFCSLLVSIPPSILLSPGVLWLIKTFKKKRKSTRRPLGLNMVTYLILVLFFQSWIGRN